MGRDYRMLGRELECESDPVHAMCGCYKCLFASQTAIQGFSTTRVQVSTKPLCELRSAHFHHGGVFVLENKCEESNRIQKVQLAHRKSVSVHGVKITASSAAMVTCARASDWETKSAVWQICDCKTTEVAPAGPGRG